MCLPLSKAFRKLRSIGRKPVTLDDYIHNEKPMDFSSTTTVDFSSSAYSSTNVSFVKEPPLPVRKIGMREHKAAAASLAQAFKDDEVAFYFLTTPKDANRSAKKIWKLHTKILEYTVAAHCRKGLVLSIGENHEGVALWYVPNSRGKNSSLQLR